MTSRNKTSSNEDQQLNNNPKNYNSTHPSDGDQTTKDDAQVMLTQQETATYGRRWYVLMVFFVAGILQGWIWNTYGPIAEALTLMGWSLSYVGATQVALFGSATLGAPLCVWIMDKKGK